MNMNIIKELEKEQMKSEIVNFAVGDTVAVSLKVKEGKRERIQIFEGVVLKRQGGGLGETFTVRKISYGVGVEKLYHFTHLRSKRSKLREEVKYVVLSLTTYVIEWVSVQKLKKESKLLHYRKDCTYVQSFFNGRL